MGLALSLEAPTYYVYESQLTMERHDYELASYAAAFWALPVTTAAGAGSAERIVSGSTVCWFVKLTLCRYRQMTKVGCS